VTPPLAHHFESHEQQRSTASLGMWLFLAQELLFFGGLFLVYAVARWSHPAAFAEGSAQLDPVLGTANTAILLASSFTMALAVRAGQRGRPRRIVAFLLATIVLGSAFLVVKGVEYEHKVHEGLFPGAGFVAPGEAAAAPGALQLFFSLYFAMTGLHALHMVVGVVVLAALVRPAARGRFGPDDHALLEGTGLYWHFVDVVWIFLFPLLYLLGRHG